MLFNISSSVVFPKSGSSEDMLFFKSIHISSIKGGVFFNWDRALMRFSTQEDSACFCLFVVMIISGVFVFERI